MLAQLVLFQLGVVGLYLGAELLVRGGARLARAFGVTPLAVGLTIVAFGGSMPEFGLSVLASAEGRGDLALGNVVGSNIVNIGLVLGLAAMVSPLAVRKRLLTAGMPAMIAAALLLPLLARDGELGRLDGTVLVLAFAAYLWSVLRSTGQEPAQVQREYREFEAAEGMEPAVGPRARAWSVGMVVLGLAAVMGGAELLVDAAVFFARLFGVSELVIGLTVVALGTSLPELATSVVAAVRGEADIALGNAVGSNVFNILSILGVASLVRPLAVAPSLMRFEIPVMILASVLLVPLAWTRLRLERWEGALLMGGYVVFLLEVL